MDFKIHIGTEADVAALQATTREINATSAAARQADRDQRISASLRQEIGRLDRQAAREAFAKLPAEEQLNKLLAQRAELQRRMDQPGVPRSEKVQLAYSLAGKTLDQQIAAVQQRVGTSSEQAAAQAEAERRRNLATAAKASADSILAKDAETAAAAQAKAQSMADKLSARQRELFQLARQSREQAFAELSPKQQLLALEEKRERLARLIARAGDNELRRSSLLVAQRQTEARIGALQAQPSLGSRLLGGLSSFGIPVTIGAAVTAAVFKARAVAREISAEAEATLDAASRLSVGTGRAQEFKFAGGKTNLGEGDVATNLRQISIAQDRAIAGNKDYLASFQRFGVTAADIRSKRPDEIFMQIARNAGQGGSSVANMSDAVRVLGRSADKTLGAFRQGFAEAADELRRLGGVIDDSVLRRLDDAAKQSKTVDAIIKARSAGLVAGLSEYWSINKIGWLMMIEHAQTYFAVVGKGIAEGNGWKESRALARQAVEDQNESAFRAINRVQADAEFREESIASENQTITRVKTAIDLEPEGSRKDALQKLLAERQAKLVELETGRSQKTDIEGRIEALREETAALEKKAKLDALSPQERITALTRDRAALERQIADATAQSAKDRANGLEIASLRDDEEVERLRRERAQLSDQITSEQGKLKPDTTGQRSGSERLGMFIGPMDATTKLLTSGRGVPAQDGLNRRELKLAADTYKVMLEIRNQLEGGIKTRTRLE